jgi:hypothetical protein
MASGSLIRTITGHGVGGFGYGLIWNPLSNQLIGVTPGGVNIWDALNGEPIQHFSAGISAASLSRTGRLVYGSSIIIEALDPNLLPDIEQVTTPLPFAHLSVDIQPTDTLRNAVISPAVLISLRDEANAAVGRSGIPITFRIEDNPSGGTLSGTLTRFTNAQGVVNFDDLSIDLVGDGYTLVAAVEGLPGVTSSAFTVH